MKRKIKITLAAVGALAFAGALGAAGGIEYGMMGLVPGAVCALVCLAICGACVEIGEAI